MIQEETSKKPRKYTRLTNAQIANAIEASGGMISLAARQLGVTRMTLYRRLRRNERLRELVDEQRERTLDIAESMLKRAVIRGEPYAIVFTLKCLGKSRGYVERLHVDVRDIDHLLARELRRVALGDDDDEEITDLASKYKN